MKYELYTWPHCEDCEQVKTLFDKRNIPYERVALSPTADVETKRRFGKVCSNLGDKLQKTFRNTYIFPILIGKNGDGIEKFAQGYENISAMFGG